MATKPFERGKKAPTIDNVSLDDASITDPFASMSMEDVCLCNCVCPIGPDGKYMCHLKKQQYKPCEGLNQVRVGPD